MAKHCENVLVQSIVYSWWCFFFIVGNLRLIQIHDIPVILSEMEIHFTVFQTAFANVFIHVQMYDQMLFAMFCITFT
jgi:hypothetical protein